MASALLVATLVIYAIFIQPITYCLLKHGGPGLLGWLALQVFCAIRIVGSALQIQDQKSGTSSTGTLVIANIGLSPMILGVVGVLHEARTGRDPRMSSKIEWTKVIVFHASVILAMVFVIIGVVKQVNDQKLLPTTLMKVGVILILLCDIVLAAWTLMSFRQAQRKNLSVWNDASLLLKSVLLVLPFILLRTLYSIIVAFSTNPNFRNRLAPKVCLSVVPEMLLVSVMIRSGLATRNIMAKRKEGGQNRQTTAGSQEYALMQTQA